MAHAQSLRRARSHFLKCGAVLAAIFLASVASSAQGPAQERSHATPLEEYLNKHPGLAEEFSRLFAKWKAIQSPPLRSQSRLLPLLPESTVGYAAFANYGDVLHQAVTIFHQELEQSAVLRQWWHGPEMAGTGPIAEMVLDRLYQLSLYLGDELVVSGAMNGKEPSLLVLTDIRKPGLKDFLIQTIGPFAAKPNSGVGILDLKDLATRAAPPSDKKFLVLVRPDFVVASFDLATLRNASAALDHPGAGFASTAFGKRLAQSYQGGANSVEGIDVQKLLALFPPGTDQAKRTLQLTGFGDTKYLVWEHKKVAGESVSLSELSFTGPRQGVASWLAAPAVIGGFDFLSPQAIVAFGLQLKSPPQIFDELKQLAMVSDPQAFAPLEKTEKSANVSLRDDILGRLGGEVTFELDDFTQDSVGGKVMLRASDPARLQQALGALLAAMHHTVEKSEDGGVAYFTFQIPASKRSYEVSYAFADGYWILASSREKVREAVRDHRSGESLGTSRKFLAALPPGSPAAASAVFYQNQLAMSAMSLRLVSLDLAKSLTQFGDQLMPTAACSYGEPTAIRGASTSSIGAMTAVLIAAAIAIPNVIRAKAAAYEASAVGMVRTINTAQVTYAAAYPDKGFAPDLAKLGPHPLGPSAATSTHANLIDATLGNSRCTAGSWCEKSGYRFTIMAECMGRACKDYAVVATPASSDKGGRSFCSTSDGVIRFKGGEPPFTSPVTPSECRGWAPLK